MLDLRGAGEVLIGVSALWSAVTATLAHRNTRTPNGEATLGKAVIETKAKVEEVRQAVGNHEAQLTELRRLAGLAEVVISDHHRLAQIEAP